MKPHMWSFLPKKAKEGHYLWRPKKKKKIIRKIARFQNKCTFHFEELENKVGKIENT